MAYDQYDIQTPRAESLHLYANRFALEVSQESRY
jgi:hypothetical protein